VVRLAREVHRRQYAGCAASCAAGGVSAQLSFFSCVVTVFWDFSLFPLAYVVVWSAWCSGRSVSGNIAKTDPPLAMWPCICNLQSDRGLRFIDLHVRNVILPIKNLHKFYNHLDLPLVNLSCG
jgi:hypothetical protein